MSQPVRKLKSLIYQFWHYRALIGAPLSTARFFANNETDAQSAFRYRGLRFIARKQDWVAVNEVLMDDEYQLVAEEIARLTHPVILDLGGNIGTFALYTLSRKPDARLYSVEPAQDTYQILHQNTTLNPSLHWKAIRAAIWKENGSVSFARSASSTGSQIRVPSPPAPLLPEKRRVSDSPPSPARGEGGRGDEGEQVPTLTLSSVIAQTGEKTIDLIKMDIEGAESCVVPMEEAILQKIGTLVIEIHNDRIDEREVAAVLQRCFPYLYRIPGRKSRKPLVLAVRQPRDLPIYTPSS